MASRWPPPLPLPLQRVVLRLIGIAQHVRGASAPSIKWAIDTGAPPEFSSDELILLFQRAIDLKAGKLLEGLVVRYRTLLRADALDAIAAHACEQGDGKALRYLQSEFKTVLAPKSLINAIDRALVAKQYEVLSALMRSAETSLGALGWLSCACTALGANDHTLFRILLSAAGIKVISIQHITSLIGVACAFRNLEAPRWLFRALVAAGRDDFVGHVLLLYAARGDIDLIELLAAECDVARAPSALAILPEAFSVACGHQHILDLLVELFSLDASWPPLLQLLLSRHKRYEAIFSSFRVVFAPADWDGGLLRDLFAAAAVDSATVPLAAHLANEHKLQPEKHLDLGFECYATALAADDVGAAAFIADTFHIQDRLNPSQ